MTHDEGVIKFEAAHRSGPPPTGIDLGPLVAWRRMLYRLGQIGQEPSRYGGAGFGNVSQRLPKGFAVTGTQTGGVELLGPSHFCLVERFDIGKNRVESVGPLLPSSEAMTHGMIYDLSAAVNVVLHVHSPDIWKKRLGLPCTGENVPYGTPAMAREVERLLRETDLRRRRVFVMLGHEDGVIAFGRTVEDAGQALLAVYAQALAA